MPKSILLADDSLTIQKVIELTFSDTDYELTTVGNGLEAIAAINRSRPDLVMADVVMPGKNGYEVCETIKSNPSLAEIPVILLSGTFEPFDRERAERAKANAIVTKPFDSKNLLTQVEALLASRGPTTAVLPVSAGSQSTVELPPVSSPASAETIQIPSTLSPPPPAPSQPAWMASKPAAEIAEMTFDGSSNFPEIPVPETPPAAQPADAAKGRKLEPVEFDMDDSSPFGKPVAATPFAQERPLHEVFSPFPERDNVFEFPVSEPEPKDEAAPGRTKGAGPDDVTQEIPPLSGLSEEDFPPEPVFLQPSAADSESAAPPAAAAPAAAPNRVPVGTEIENLAQHASISDLASLVSRVTPPAAMSDEDIERVARKVVEMISDKAVREIAWEVVPDMAEIAVRKRLRELEAESGETD